MIRSMFPVVGQMGSEPSIDPNRPDCWRGVRQMRNHHGVGRGCGVGRGLGVTLGLGVADGVGVGVGVGVEMSSQVSLKYPLLS